MKHVLTAAMIGGTACAAFAVPALAKGPVLAMLDRLDKGSWELRYRNEAGKAQRICVDNGRTFIQLRHSSARCSSVVVDDRPSEVTVQYTCPGNGYGRTHIRFETSKLVQIDSQGISGGLPFAFEAEARRVGDCRG